MFKFIAFLFLIFLFLLTLMGFTIVRSIKQFFFGGNNNKQSHRQQQHRTSPRSDSNRSQSSFYADEENSIHPNDRPRCKVYGKDEGEYVDYEEVK